MNYTRINNLTGWAVFGVTLLVYLLTVAPTASFWDCGEFIACANELEVTHPPGAPLFLLLGRIFAMFSFGDVTRVAFMVNLLSAISSAFTALFTFWTVTILARKGLAKSEMDEQGRLIAGMAAGVVAGLTCAFADSIWFNAVEAEVYALSSFFTAIVVWLMFKWEARADEPDHLRWIVLIAYIMGLSIGVHLLNLLTIPALALVYYYRKFDFSWLGFLATMAISVVILAVVQYGIIQYQFSIALAFEKFFTGTVTRAGVDQGGLGLPMGTGALVFGLLVLAVLVGLLFYSHRQRKVVLNTVLLSLAVIQIGFSSYGMIFIRSNVNPPIDMNNPENILTFLSYMRREQYGDRPLLRGPLYNGQVERDARGYPVTKVKGMKYMKVEGIDKYVEDTEDVDYVYRDQDVVWFPRMYSPERYNSGPFGYVNYVKRKGQDPNSPYDDRPTKGEDWRFFFDYQLSHMYLRYFMWNFVGRESDIQEARWESGLEWGDVTRFTPEKVDNKAKNHYYFLPLFFGLLGLVWQISVRRRDAAVVGLLFFFTGVAIILYLNQYPLQPRERDYSYAGSFQTFAMWVGLGVLFLADLLRRYLGKITPWVAGGLAMLAPLIMLAENWDDHTRKGRWIDIEFAKNLLDSCEEDAILFTGGDNDTFPLWYVQEVEGYRTDVRVVNLELLISDWYVDQQRESQNGAAPLPLSPPALSSAGDAGLIRQGYASREFRLPVDKAVAIETGLLTPEEAALAGDEMVWEFQARGSSRNPYILRKDTVLIDLLTQVAADGWRRPIYFANTQPTSNFLNLNDWFRLEGLAYRVVPVKRSDATPNDIYNGWIGQERMFKHLTEDFRYRGIDDPSVHFDEHIRNVIIGNYRNAFFRLSNSYADQIAGLYQQNQQLERLLSEGGAAADSAQSQLAANRTRADELRGKIQQLQDFSEEKMPEAVVAKPMPLRMTELQMFSRAGMGDLLATRMQSLVADALAELEIYREAGEPMNPQMMPVRACLIAVQFYAQNGQKAEAEALSDQLLNLTGQDWGRAIMQPRQ